MTISYDKIADVLYLTFSFPQSKANYIEIDGGVLRVDVSTKQVIGVTIPFFREQFKNKARIEFPAIGPVPFTSFTEDVLRTAKSHAGNDY